jgi:hypothetical protein
VAVTAEGLLDAFYTRFIRWYNATVVPQGAAPFDAEPAGWQSPGLASLLGCEPDQATEWLGQFYEADASASLDEEIAESLHFTSQTISLLARQGVIWHVLITRHGQHEEYLREWLLQFYRHLSDDVVSLLKPYDSNAHTIDIDAMRGFCDAERIRMLVHNEPQALQAVCSYESDVRGILAGPDVGWINGHEPDYDGMQIRRVLSWRDMPRALDSRSR